MGWKKPGEKPFVDTPWFRLNLAHMELPGGRRLNHQVLRLLPVVLAGKRRDRRESPPAGEVAVKAGPCRDLPPPR